jgi:hypothetical protein
LASESEKHGEQRNQVHEEGLKSEEAISSVGEAASSVSDDASSVSEATSSFS